MYARVCKKLTKYQIILSDEIVQFFFAATCIIAFANMDSNGTVVGWPTHGMWICMHGSDIWCVHLKIVYSIWMSSRYRYST